jgi:hypothetical protein
LAVKSLFDYFCICMVSPQSSLAPSCSFQSLSWCAALLTDISVTLSYSMHLSLGGVCLEVTWFLKNLFQMLCFTFLEF